MIGKSVDQYRILSLLGKGGMGDVYRAHDTRLERDVALKALPEKWSGDGDRVSRFQREAKILASLEHPNIASVYGIHEKDGTHFIAMELIDGPTLATAISEEEPLSLERLLKITVPLADALAHAHDRGVVHRDLKPANVMMDSSGRIRILDFGLAIPLLPEVTRDTDETVEALAEESSFAGTLGYMAPEQLQGYRMDARADLFSLGVLLFELATGKQPFKGNTAAGIVSAILRDDPPPLSKMRPDLPLDLGRLIRRCLKKDPDRRIQTARDIRNQLEELRETDIEHAAPPDAGDFTVRVRGERPVQTASCPRGSQPVVGVCYGGVSPAFAAAEVPNGRSFLRSGSVPPDFSVRGGATSSRRPYSTGPHCPGHGRQL